MKKGYQKILSRFEIEFPAEMSISKIKEFLPKTTEQDLLGLKLAGFLEIDGHKDKFGDHLHKISEKGFSHLVQLRTYHMTKKTKELTNWIIILTIFIIILSIIQICTF